MHSSFYTIILKLAPKSASQCRCTMPSKERAAKKAQFNARSENRSTRISKNSNISRSSSRIRQPPQNRIRHECDRLLDIQDVDRPIRAEIGSDYEPPKLEKDKEKAGVKEGCN